MTIAADELTLRLSPPETTSRPSWRRRALPITNPVQVSGHDAETLKRHRSRGATLLVVQPWQRQRPWVRVRLAVVLPLLLFGFSLYQNLANMDTVDFHRDEARWINRASFLEDLLDPFGETWTDYYTTRGQPPLGNYLMALGLLAQGRDLDTNRVWDFHYDEEWNAYAGAMPDAGDLNAGRRTNAVAGALVVACVYFLASKLTNRVGGFAAGFFLSLHPLHLRLSSQALSDELLALLLALSFLAAWRFGHRPSLANGIALGALLGLGGAAKLSPLLLSLPLAALGAVWLMDARWRRGAAGLTWRRARFGWLLVAQPVIAAATFVIVNPYLWPDPIGRTIELFEFRRTEMELQSSAWPIAGVDSPLVALERTGRRFNTDYSTSIRVQEWLGHTISAEFTPFSFDTLLMAAGFVVLLAIVVRAGPWSPQTLAAYLMAASCGVVIVGMGVDFYRYFLPLIVVASVCVGVAVGAAFGWIQGHGVPSPEERGAPVSASRRPKRPPARGTIAG